MLVALLVAHHNCHDECEGKHVLRKCSRGTVKGGSDGHWKTADTDKDDDDSSDVDWLAARGSSREVPNERHDS